MACLVARRPRRFALWPAPGVMAGISDSEKLERAAALVRDDAEIGGLMQMLALALHSKGLSAADIDGVCSRRRGTDEPSGSAGWTGWLEDWLTETGCWLRQPGVWDGVSE